MRFVRVTNAERIPCGTLYACNRFSLFSDLRELGSDLLLPESAPLRACQLGTAVPAVCYVHEGTGRPPFRV
jgi:hypothetical protein